MTYGGSVLMKIHESGEDYLEAIFVLQQKKEMVRSVDVSQHLGVKKPSVCHAVSILDRKSTRLNSSHQL